LGALDKAPRNLPGWAAKRRKIIREPEKIFRRYGPAESWKKGGKTWGPERSTGSYCRLRKDTLSLLAKKKLLEFQRFGSDS